MKKCCLECMHFDSCYPTAWGHAPFPGATPDYFNAIRTRDVCVNNNKINYTANRRKGERRGKYQ